jgi:hypothetical protein
MKLGKYILAGLVALIPMTAIGEPVTFTCEDDKGNKNLTSVDISKNELKFDDELILKIVGNSDKAILAYFAKDDGILSVYLNKLSGIATVAILSPEENKINTVKCYRPLFE